MDLVRDMEQRSFWREQFVLLSVVDVNKDSDRVVGLKVDVEGVILKVVWDLAPQVGCKLVVRVVSSGGFLERITVRLEERPREL